MGDFELVIGCRLAVVCYTFKNFQLIFVCRFFSILTVINKDVMKKGLLLVLLFVSFVGSGQCPTDDFYIATQSEIDAFASNYPNCTNLTYSLNIRGNDIVNLQGLSQIEDVGGGLIIDLTNIENLQGLENIHNLSSSLIITSNYALESFDGLQNLETIAGQFAVAFNSQIINFTGFDSLNSVGTVSAFGMHIASNNNLVSLVGLENLTQIHGSFRIDWNDSLESLNGLQNLDSVYGWIGIRDNDVLETLEGIESLVYCDEYLSIIENESLSSISSLTNLDVSDLIGVIIEDNPSLSFCAVNPVCDAIFSPNTAITINNNLNGCNSEAEVESQCQLSITEEDFTKNLSVFPNPVSSILNIETSNTISFERATVYSTLGRLILQTSEKQINLESLSAGIYFVEVVTDKGTVTKKIVKQ
ncbi:T9SS type A sorting domain-containing protein [Aequorivita sp. SDUM287046]|uniref:T9SS type A sorting domain-containing protein n=1 Tax=Aequorivita aurantiaca TaxID=3053356 RepID=A0ABT8DHD8_9FLAO|nr:T9SS type A sorting domain-containing protein [Aequorivita aurantiaca]MDN3724815.1 T9SS type A sorting domain-containing protein [Aequorivita aurantiaca]